MTQKGKKQAQNFASWRALVENNPRHSKRGHQHRGSGYQIRDQS